MRRGTWAYAAALVVLYAALIALPHVLSFSQQELIVFAAINVLVVVSYRFLTLTGEWSLGHVVMVGVGAYASALFAKLGGFPVPVAMLCGAITAAAVAWVLSFPLFRMKAFYFLIGSFAAGEVIRLCWKRFREPFGGPKGLKLVPAMPDIELGALKISFFSPVNYYYLCLAIISVAIFILYRLERSRMGLTFHAVHWQDKLAESVGVNTRRYRTAALVVASFFAGLAGTLMVHYLGTVNPNQFDVEQMVFVLIWVIVGGTATIYGPILGVVVLTAINEIFLRQVGSGELRPMFYGAILIAAILFLPRGLESLFTDLRKLLGRRGGRQREAAAEGAGAGDG